MLLLLLLLLLLLFCGTQKDLYGANVIIFEGIMAFVYPELVKVKENSVLVSLFIDLSRVYSVL